jgi:hypothetical protein
MNDFIATYRMIHENRKEEFFNKGYKKRYFFPHKIYYIPRCGVDGFESANIMWNIRDPNRLWEIVLYAVGCSIDEFPRDLFFDENVIWHQRHLGKTGQIASANLILDHKKVYTLEHISDLVQRIYLRKEYRTRVESWFKHWHHMLLNSILNFAVERRLQYIYSPTADLVVYNYVNRKVNRKLFDRIYDRDVTMHFKVDQKDGWWVINVDNNRHKLVVPEQKKEILKNNRKTICLFHDIERGLGHVGTDPELAKVASNNAADSLDKMLTVEKEMNVKATYNVVGIFFDEVRAKIEQNGHCIAFHSYNHQISHQLVTDYIGEADRLVPISRVYGKVLNEVNIVRRRLSLPPIINQPIPKVYRNVANSLRRKLRLSPLINQLAECRNVDYRIKGYRPSQTRISQELSDTDLCYYNFEWLAINEHTSRAKPTLQNRIVKIPTYCDDYQLYKHNMPYNIWERKIVEEIKQSDFVAFGLHDCYAHYWLSSFPDLLKKISALGQFKTFDEVTNQVLLANAA